GSDSQNLRIGVGLQGPETPRLRLDQRQGVFRRNVRGVLRNQRLFPLRARGIEAPRSGDVRVVGKPMGDEEVSRDTLKSVWSRPKFQGIIQGMIAPSRELEALSGLLRRHPVVGVVGARQVGKTTLARAVAARANNPGPFFDLENPSDLARLADPMLAL